MKIKIRDFQPFSNAEIDAEGLTVIVGKSNLGKSSLIRAIEAALFNREGDAFVRQGKQSAYVCIEGVPHGGTIEWQKGSGLNQFTVDGVEYKKTGTTAPPVIQDWGYRDVWIGDKDRRRGEFIRPQVADQFDRLFLLDRTGSFVAEVLSAASRIGVLTNADRACSTDLKSARSLVTVRRSDLEVAEKRLEAMQPIVAFHRRIQDLKDAAAVVAQARARRDKLRDLLLRRMQLNELYLHLPEKTDVTLTEIDTTTASHANLTRLVKRRAALKAADLTLSDPVVTLQSLADHDQFEHRVVTLRELVQLRKVKVPALPDQQIEYTAVLKTAEDWHGRLLKITTSHNERQRWFGHLAQQQSSKRSLGTDLEIAQADLALLQQELKTCPVCDKPF